MLKLHETTFAVAMGWWRMKQAASWWLFTRSLKWNPGQPNHCQERMRDKLNPEQEKK